MVFLREPRRIPAAEWHHAFKVLGSMALYVGIGLAFYWFSHRGDGDMKCSGELHTTSNGVQWCVRND